MKRIYNAPCGDLLIEVKGGAVWQCRWCFDFSDSRCWETIGTDSPDSLDTAVMESARSQLNEYFGGERAFFELPLRLNGTLFREKVWRALTEIPFGETRSYSQIAENVGCRGGQRAVAQACSCNRLAILVPCHRVVTSDGTLGGYTVTDDARRRGSLPQGLAIKKFLLALERQNKS